MLEELKSEKLEEELKRRLIVEEQRLELKELKLRLIKKLWENWW